MTAVLEPIVVEEVVVPTPTLADHYDLAASLIEEYGWVQGRFGSKQIGFCLIGAIREAVNGGYRWDENRYEPIVNATTKRRLSDGRSADGGAIWNDASGRTKEEVIAKLHEVASQLRSQDGNTDR